MSAASDNSKPTYMESHFEFSHAEPPVYFYRPRADAGPVFRRDRLARVDAEARIGYVHAQSLADCMLLGRVDASRFFADPTGAYRRALRRQPDFSHSLWREDIGPSHGMWMHPDLVPAFVEWVQEPGREPKRFRHLAEIKDDIARKTDGVTGVRCRAGHVDVVSYPQGDLIVVEDVTEWARGLGRLAAFGIDFESFNHRLHLYCTHDTSKDVKEDQLHLLREVCRKCEVELTLDDNVVMALEDRPIAP
eukprot:jgi/Mesvir1/19536/Mv18056-RA.1